MADVHLLSGLSCQQFINGQSVEGEGQQECIVNPANGETLVSITEASSAQVGSAVKAAQQAFGHWSRTTPAYRASILLRIADAIERQAPRLAGLEALNCGKPLHQALNDDLPAAVDVFRFFAGAVRTQQGQLAGEYIEGHTSMIRRDPVGVVASIAPWNYPLMMAAWKIAPALAAGNTVVFKPSEHTPLTILALVPALQDILPPGVLNIIYGGGEGVGSHLVGHPQVRLVSVTGDIVTGQKILQAAAKSVKRTHLELGGKAPMIVLEELDKLKSGHHSVAAECRQAIRLIDKTLGEASPEDVEVGVPIQRGKSGP
uniref:aldehyde dehydrogenase family protein n=1 Tax=Serratia quinivorans TaxID=137545 RepID=UPI0035C73A66